MGELARRPVVIDGTCMWSSLDTEPWPGSPLLQSGLAWSPTSRDDIAASIEVHRSRRRWWPWRRR